MQGGLVEAIIIWWFLKTMVGYSTIFLVIREGLWSERRTIYILIYALPPQLHSYLVSNSEPIYKPVAATTVKYIINSLRLSSGKGSKQSEADTRVTAGPHPTFYHRLHLYHYHPSYGHKDRRKDSERKTDTAVTVKHNLTVGTDVLI
jgi:hypothetical protein